MGYRVKLENLFNGIQENVEFLEEKMEQYQNDLEASKAEYEKPFVHEEELREKLHRHCELNAQLDLENEQVQDADLGGVEEKRNEDTHISSVAEEMGEYAGGKKEYYRR